MNTFYDETSQSEWIKFSRSKFWSDAPNFPIRRICLPVLFNSKAVPIIKTIVVVEPSRGNLSYTSWRNPIILKSCCSWLRQ